MHGAALHQPGGRVIALHRLHGVPQLVHGALADAVRIVPRPEHVVQTRGGDFLLLARARLAATAHVEGAARGPLCLAASVAESVRSEARRPHHRLERRLHRGVRGVVSPGLEQERVRRTRAADEVDQDLMALGESRLLCVADARARDDRRECRRRDEVTENHGRRVVARRGARRVRGRARGRERGERDNDVDRQCGAREGHGGVAGSGASLAVHVSFRLLIRRTPQETFWFRQNRVAANVFSESTAPWTRPRRCLRSPPGGGTRR